MIEEHLATYLRDRPASLKEAKEIEAAGGEVIIEELCEGIRYYWYPIGNNGDPFQSLAQAYLKGIRSPVPS